MIYDGRGPAPEIKIYNISILNLHLRPPVIIHGGVAAQTINLLIVLGLTDGLTESGMQIVNNNYVYIY